VTNHGKQKTADPSPSFFLASTRMFRGYKLSKRSLSRFFTRAKPSASTSPSFFFSSLNRRTFSTDQPSSSSSSSPFSFASFLGFSSNINPEKYGKIDDFSFDKYKANLYKNAELEDAEADLKNALDAQAKEERLLASVALDKDSYNPERVSSLFSLFYIHPRSVVLIAPSSRFLARPPLGTLGKTQRLR
jgi:hypothetical protein